MTAPHEVLNAAPGREAEAMLERCCGSARWVQAMLARRPFASLAELEAAADGEWARLAPDDWREAFGKHPRIGADAGAGWSREEQSAARRGDPATLDAIREGNRAYEERFGHVFLVCATGKSAAEILAALRARLAHDPHVELRVAAAEHARITRLRLEKLAR